MTTGNWRRRYSLAARYAWRFRQLLWKGLAYFDDVRNAYLLRDNLLQSGPLFVKLGQWISQRPDLFGRKFTAVMEDLQARVPPHSWTHTEQTLRRVFPFASDPANGGEVFISLEKDAMASGSIAQVYRGKARRSALQRAQRRIDAASEKRTNADSDDNDSIVETEHNPIDDDETTDGDAIVDVVVKVRHPKVREEFQEGLDALSVFFDIGKACGYVIFSIVRFEDMTNEMMSQVNLREEAQAMRDFRDNFAGNSMVSFPEPLLWSEEVLVETHQTGIYYSDIGTENDSTWYANEAEANACRDLCKQVTLAAYLQMLLHDGVIHGDCHNGNILYSIERKSDEELAYERRHSEKAAQTRAQIRQARKRRVDAMPKPATIGNTVVKSTSDESDEEEEELTVIYPVRVRVSFLDFGIVLRFGNVHRRNHLNVMVHMHAGAGLEVARGIRELMIETDQFDERSYVQFERDCIDTVEELMRLDKEGTGVPISVTMMSIMNLVHKHRLWIDSTTGRMMVGYILIEQGRVHKGQDNVTSNTMRWLLYDDCGENFPLVPYVAQVMSAKVTQSQATPVGPLPPLMDPTVEKDVHQRKETALAFMNGTDHFGSLADIASATNSSVSISSSPSSCSSSVCITSSTSDARQSKTTSIRRRKKSSAVLATTVGVAV